MAMSRSLGALWSSTCTPMRSSPEVMSSSPAIMLSVVDLPHPDGPTRITNSPSAMSRLILFTASAPSGKRLVIWSRTISAIVCSLVPVSRLALDRAGCQPGHDPALEEQDEDDDRDADDDRRGRRRPDRRAQLQTAAEEGQRARSTRGANV